MVSRQEQRQIRETFYELERQYGAEAVVEEFQFVRRNDESFQQGDFGGLL